MYEVLWSGAPRSVEEALNASYEIVYGGLNGWASSYEVQLHSRTVGMRPKLGEENALFAHTDAEVEERYREDGPVRPILFRLSEVEGAARGPRDVYAIQLVSVRVPRLRRSGDDWDPFGGLPDPLVYVSGATRWQGHLEDRTIAEFHANLGNHITVNARSPLNVAVYDKDMGEHDLMGSVSITSEAQGTLDYQGITWFPTASGVEIGLLLSPGW